MKSNKIIKIDYIYWKDIFYIYMGSKLDYYSNKFVFALF